MGNYQVTKRKHDESCQEDAQESVVEVPKKKKLRTTSDYIYNTLFVGGQDSDVTLVALGIEWKLHKLYLCQSNYFKSMFLGPWKESQQNLIKLEIPDENIDEEALHTAFGSFYCDEVEISSQKVVPLLSVACMFQLDGLLAKCAEMMIENLNSQTVCRYYAAAVQYGQLLVETNCTEWLERRLTSSATVELLKDISIELMEQVVKSPNLFVMQIEVDTYNLAKMWMFLKLNPSWEGNKKDLLLNSNTYFQSRTSERAFLETEEGGKFTCVFEAIRLHHVICDIKAVRQLDQDKIIPNEWLSFLYKQQWERMLLAYQGVDSGPEEGVTEQEFDKLAFRCGRILDSDMQYCWRWTGFTYGVDIIVTYNSRKKFLTFKRNMYTQPCSTAICMQLKRDIMCKVQVAVFDSDGKEKYYKCSGLLHTSLGPDEELCALHINEDIDYPLHVSAHIAVLGPKEEPAEQE